MTGTTGSYQFMRFVVQLSIHVSARAMLAPLWRQRPVLGRVHLHLYPVERIWRDLRTPGSCN